MSNILMTMGAVGALAAGTLVTLPASSGSGSQESPLRCEIKLTRTAQGVQLEAWVRATAAADGEYQLTVTKTGSGGSSDVSQGGEFSVGARSATILGATEFGLEPRARLKARLVLSGREGQLCSHDLES